MPPVKKTSDRIIFNDSTEQTTAAVASTPPVGKFKVTNLYVNEEGKLIVEWDNKQ